MLSERAHKHAPFLIMASFAPEVIFHIGSFPITNTILDMVFVDIVLIGSAIFISKNIKKIPGTFQNILETAITSFLDTLDSVAGKNSAKIFPWFMTFFFLILVANWSGLIPGVGTIGFTQTVHGEEEFVPLIRNATSDLNVTLALAAISLVATHTLSIKTVGMKSYLLRYLSLNPILLFVGLLEIVSEFTKVVSLSFRLFGNIFAGEVVLHTVSKIFAFGFPVPFLLLEVIVGLVQALVFSMLTMAFMSILMTPHHPEESGAH